MKVVINTCYGGFGLSDLAYERLVELGVPVRKYIPEGRDPETGRYKPVPENEGEIIFDRTLTPEGDDSMNDLFWKSFNAGHHGIVGRYWDTWTSDARSHRLIVRVVEELGEKASGRYSDLKVVEIPDGVEYFIDEYDGMEHIAEKHRTWS